MNSKERKQVQSLIKRAREQRNATTNNDDFDYWHGVYEHYLSVLKTGESK
jgi:hypothetical protein